MNDQFNPYVEWLGLTDVVSRPNHYRLLGLELYESDPQRIKQQADRTTTRVRGFRPGDKARYWSTLLDEVDAARKCLSDEQQRREYDEQLRRQGPETLAKPAATTSTAPAAPIGNPAMYPPGMGGPMPERYGPAGPAPDDAPQQFATANAAPFTTSRFAPGYDAGGSLPASVSAQGGAPVGMTRKLPMGRDAMPGAADPMAPVFGAQPFGDPMAPMADPMAPAQPYGSAALAQPYGGAPQAQAYGQPNYGQPSYGQPTNYGQPNYAQPNYGQPSYGQGAAGGGAVQPVTAVPLGGGIASPMAPVAMPVGTGGYDPNYGSAGWGSPYGAVAGASPVAAMPMGGAAAAPQIAADKQRPSGNGVKLLLAGIVGAVVLGIGGLLAVAMMWGRDSDPETPSVASVDPDEPPRQSTTPDDEPAADVPEPEPEPEPEPPDQPDPMPVDPEPELEPPAPEPEPEPAPPEPAPMPEPEPPPAQALTAQEKSSLKKSLIAARQAMADRDLETARKKLADAEKIARSKEHVALVDRTKELENYVSQFWEAVDKGYAGLQPTGTLTIGTAEAAVVEVRDDALIIKWFGRNRTIPRDGMPAGLAMAIANTWFDDNAQNKVIRGAFLLVDPNGKPDEAERLWEEAGDSGVSVKSLMPVLTDDYEI